MRSADFSRYPFYSLQLSRMVGHAGRLRRGLNITERSKRPVIAIGAVVLAAMFAVPAAASACHGDPFVDAAALYQLDPDLLRAITWVESRGLPGAVGPKLSGGHRAWGAAQINDIHLPELVSYGVTRQDLLDPCVNLKLSAWVLASCIRSKGATWAAVGCYNAGPASSNLAAQAKYVRLVQRAYAGYRAQSAAPISANGGAK
ncbi:lytic transglycosylase domain-containing protein [Burkholderia plantarii]|uniref:lytic transglycosylase domain-containing protein n=2 Tax=Burkholderia plantarii TaxID=41899 RepID=UPI0030841DE3